ncbi:hypothetical protein ACHAXN_006695, partial [Cyclotella atomus]
GFIHIKNLLLGEECELESLALDRVDIEVAAALDHIASGLARNNSVKSIRVAKTECNNDTMCQLFLASMAKFPESHQFNVTEKLQLVGSGREDCSDLAKLVKKMPRLRCLDIEDICPASVKTDSDEATDGDLDSEKDLFLHMPSSLEELKITDNSLISYLSTKKCMTRINPRDFSLYTEDKSPLKKLDLAGKNNYLSTEQWARLFQSLHNINLEELSMVDFE